MSSLRPLPLPATSLLQHLCRAILRLSGWRIDLAEMPPARCVVIGAHHTTWFDLIMTLLLMGATGLRLRWVAKADVFRGPLGWLLRSLGGIPVRRSARANFVQQMVNVFANGEALHLAILPEGTRQYCDHWKTGFYYIALGAGVPIVPGYADYQRKILGLGPVMPPSGNIEDDFAHYRAFYATITARYPAQQGEVRLSAADQAGLPPPSDG